MREIYFYKTKSDKCPVVDFLNSLTGTQAQKATWVMQLIEDLPKPSVKFFKKLVNTADI